MRTALFGLFLSVVSSAPAADWPQYRGPNRNDVSPETGLLKTWPKEGPPLAWTYSNAGVGYSPPSVVGDRVYITGGRGDKEYLVALDTGAVRDGTVKEAWAAEVGPIFRWKGNSWSAGPSATPTVDGQRVYAIGGNGDLVCVEAASGRELWRVNMPKDLDGQVNPIGGGPKNLGWGFTASPLVDGEKLIVVPGGPKGTLAALHKETGKVLWRSAELKDQAAYTSPMALEVGGVRQYAVLTNQGLSGVSAKDGKLLWRHTRERPYGTEVVNTPLVHGNLLYTTVAAGNGGCELVKVEPDREDFKVTPIYSNKTLSNHHGNVVLVGGHVFGFGQGAGWVCQDFLKSDVVWSERKFPGGSVTCADGRLYCYSENDGTAALVEVSETGWKETGRFKIPKQSTERAPQGKVWTPPVVSNGRLYLRDQENVFCYDVKAR